jgi:hypothetical protein
MVSAQLAFYLVNYIKSNCCFLVFLEVADEVVKKSPGEKFVEDIEAAQEELGYLVLTDLEDDKSSVQTLVRETSSNSRESPPFELDSHGAKLAFASRGEDEELEKQWETFNETLGEPSKSEVIAWGDHSMEFKPSKWNHSLTPSRPAIKSPAVVPEEKNNVSEEELPLKGGMKKSVSFELSKSQLVYKYPPPEPGSDSEEGEGNRFNVINARKLRLSSGTNNPSRTTTSTVVPTFPAIASASTLGKLSIIFAP